MVSIDKIKDRYDELCKRFQTFTDEEHWEAESIVAHCTALNLPVQCANKTGDQDTDDHDTTKSKQRRPNKRKTIIPTNTTISTPVLRSGALPTLGPAPSSQSNTPSRGNAPTAPAQIPLKRPIEHNNIVPNMDHAPPLAKRANHGHKKQEIEAGEHKALGVRAQTLKENPQWVEGDPASPYHRFMAAEARQAYVAQVMGPEWMKLDASSKVAGFVAARQHAQLLESGVPDSCLIPVVYGMCGLTLLLCLY